MASALTTCATPDCTSILSMPDTACAKRDHPLRISSPLLGGSHIEMGVSIVIHVCIIVCCTSLGPSSRSLSRAWLMWDGKSPDVHSHRPAVTIGHCVGTRKKFRNKLLWKLKHDLGATISLDELLHMERSPKVHRDNVFPCEPHAIFSPFRAKGANGHLRSLAGPHFLAIRDC